MHLFNFLRAANVLIHIIAGSVALILGIVALSSKKGRQLHANTGRWFLALLTVVIFTGLLGVFVFGRNTFLLVITVLSGYLGFSGYRVLQNKANQPKAIDIAVAFAALFAVLYFLYYFKSIGMMWAPVIIYSTVGALLAVVGYDLLRYLIPSANYGMLWMYEHIYKMIGAFSGLLAAFCGTVFKSYQPYSQVLPSVLGILLQVGCILFFYRKNNRLLKKQE